MVVWPGTICHCRPIAPMAQVRVHGAARATCLHCLAHRSKRSGAVGTEQSADNCSAMNDGCSFVVHVCLQVHHHWIVAAVHCSVICSLVATSTNRPPDHRRRNGTTLPFLQAQRSMQHGHIHIHRDQIGDQRPASRCYNQRLLLWLPSVGHIVCAHQR